MPNNPRSLADEVVPSKEGKEEDASAVASQIGTLRQVLELFPMPGWEHLMETFRFQHTVLLDQLVRGVASDPHAIGVMRGKAQTLETFLGLNDSINLGIAQAEDQLKKLEEGEEPNA